MVPMAPSSTSTRWSRMSTSAWRRSWGLFIRKECFIYFISRCRDGTGSVVRVCRSCARRQALDAVTSNDQLPGDVAEPLQLHPVPRVELFGLPDLDGKRPSPIAQAGPQNRGFRGLADEEVV